MIGLMQRLERNDPDLVDLSFLKKCVVSYKDIQKVKDYPNYEKEATFFNLNLLDSSSRIFNSLKNNTVVKSLWIAHGLKDNKIDTLANLIKVNRSVTSLMLGFIGLGPHSDALKSVNLLNLGAALKVNNSLTYLRIGNSFVGTGINRLFESLKFNRKLLHLDLNSIYLETKVIASVLKVNQTLTTLSLGGCIFDLEELLASLKFNRSLSQLVLKNCNLESEELAKALQVDQTTLTTLELDYCRGLIGLAEGMKKNRSLTDLSIVTSFACIDSFNFLTESLKVNQSLRWLKLDCPLADISELGDGLKVNRTLVGLYIHRGKAKSVKAFAEGLKANKTLTDLRLFSCKITDISDLAEALRVNTTLKYLDISENHLDPAGAKLLGNVLKENATLTRLGLNNCSLHDLTDFAEGLKVNKSVFSLDLFNSGFGDSNDQALLSALKVNSTLTSLKFLTLNEDIKKQIEEKVKYNQSLAKQTGNKEAKAILVHPPTAAPIASTASAGVVIKEEMVEKMNALQERQDMLARQVQRLAVIDTTALEVLKGRTDQLLRLFEAEAKSEHNRLERERIEANPSLQIYYQYFIRLLNGSWLACQTICSGMVANDESYASDYFALGLDEIGKRVPGVGLATGIISGVIKGWNFREKKQGVQRIALLFPDLNTAFKELNQLAIQATLSQEKEISALPPPQSMVAKIKEGVKDFAALILGSDVNTPLKRKAETDCKTLLNAIKEGKLPQKATLDDLLSTLGVRSICPSSVAPPAQAPVSAEVNIGHLVEELRQLKQRELEREVEVKRLREEVAQLKTQQPSNEEVHFGSDEVQLQLLKVKKVESESSPHATHALIHETLVLKTEVAVLKARQEEHSDAIDTAKADLALLKKKIR